jgi:alpha-galactosidase
MSVLTAAQASMLFGVHIALAQVNEHSDVAFHHPQWMTPGLVKDYFGATGICLNNPDAKAWLQAQIVDIIDNYDVDYIVTDSEDFLKMCTQLPDFNYVSAVFGLDALVAQVRAQRPHVVWEYCSDGGNMNTFRMAQLFDTANSIDAGNSYNTRAGSWAHTFPYAPRFAAKYVPCNLCALTTAAVD